jgi:uncharacterized membrane protein (UPF0127 family)
MVALALAALAAMAPAMAQVVFPRSQAEIVTAAGRRHVIAVELATSADQLAQGLMFRKVMAADAGMLFDFGRTRAISMWMKNTLIPLDMLFLDPHGRVLGIVERAVPGSLAMIESPGPVRGVLELNGGTASRLGLEPGDRVLHPLFPAP